MSSVGMTVEMKGKLFDISADKELLDDTDTLSGCPQVHHSTVLVEGKQ